MCGKPHKGECLSRSNAYFTCGKPDHHAKDCRSGCTKPQGKRGQVVVTQRTNWFYALHGLQEVDKALDMVIDMFRVFYYDIYALLDRGANLSFVNPFLGYKFHACPEVLYELYEVSNPVGESTIAWRFYRSCPISVLHKDISCDLVELSMVEFDLILEMDWLYVSYASIDCRYLRFKFHFPNEPVHEWEGSNSLQQIWYRATKLLVTTWNSSLIIHFCDKKIYIVPKYMRHILLVTKHINLVPHQKNELAPFIGYT